ncbi:hypothetical protein OYE22_29625 [Streptomyces sp. 71268]|uniref:hypothetical protein n=1 Tax=Streptomyces sp. 71268 TaxID=3002640 RepID=UPI0023F8A078|nr:hypothetical protein [Streptomyces sp. 71268]WEV28882.1 hypothetical protein OYE22_29625 [Streptomyces sp. 71268]
MSDGRYVRFQGTARNERGAYPGVFVLVNGLAREGRLTAEQERFRRTSNAWYDAAYTNPSHVDTSVYDRERHPTAVAWFRSSARHLIERVDGYLEILTAHGVGWVRLSSTDPGRVLYEDAVQIVVVPHAPAAPGGAADVARLR